MSLYGGYFAEGFKLDPTGKAELKITTDRSNAPNQYVFENTFAADAVWEDPIHLTTGHPVLTFKQDPSSAEKEYTYNKEKACWTCQYVDTHNWWKFKVHQTRWNEPNDPAIKALIKFTNEHEGRRAEVNEMFRQIMESAEHDILDYTCKGDTKEACAKRLDQRANSYMIHILGKANAWRRAQQEKINLENQIRFVYKKNADGNIVVHPEDPKIIEKWKYRLPGQVPRTDKEAKKFPCPQ